VQGDGVGREHEFEKTAAQYRKRGPHAPRIELAGGKPSKIQLALAADHGAEELLLPGEMGVDGRLRHTRLAGDRIHADRAKTGGEKGPFRRGENALRFAGRDLIALEDGLHHACHAACRHDTA